jgi:phage terminase large subunit
VIAEAYEYPGISILCTRKTLPSLRMTSYKLILQLLDEYGLPYELNKTELIITFPNRSEILFKSLDEPEKIKSAEFDRIWVEEVTEFKLEEYQHCNLRLRRNKAPPDRMYLTCNPVSKFSWVYKELVEKHHKDVVSFMSNYHDNPFISQDYIDYLESQITQDINLYKIYCLGEWGILENLIYSNWEPVDAVPENPDEIVYGLDFGFNNPTALVEISVKDNLFYVRELLYETKITNKELVDRMFCLILDHERPIYADSSEPARIQEIFDQGFNVKPAVKHADTIARKGVTEGIDYVKTKHLFITKDSVNLLKEINSYKWKEDKDGNILDEPVKFNDHSLDALRYCLVSHFRLQGGTTSFYLG